MPTHLNVKIHFRNKICCCSFICYFSRPNTRLFGLFRSDSYAIGLKYCQYNIVYSRKSQSENIISNYSNNSNSSVSSNSSSIASCNNNSSNATRFPIGIFILLSQMIERDFMLMNFRFKNHNWAPEIALLLSCAFVSSRYHAVV